MNNKKTSYVLLPVVVAIWSIIIYRIYSAVHQENISSPKIAQVELPGMTHSKITPKKIQLNTIERDPFLNKEYRNRDIPQKKERFEHIEWPLINYLGLISASTSQEKIAIFKINNQEVILGINEEFKGIKVLSANSQKAKIIYKNKQKSFNK